MDNAAKRIADAIKLTEPGKAGTIGGTVGRTTIDALRAVDAIRDLLWPGSDADHEWDVETIESVARALRTHGFGPEK